MKKIIKNIYVLPVVLCLSLYSYTVNAEIAVIVHPSNISEMDANDVNKLFLGHKKSFPTGDTAILVVQDGDSADEFNEKVLKRSSHQFKAYWSKMIFSGKGSAPTNLSNDAEVKKVISSNANTIGYIDASQVDDSVRVLFSM